MIAEPADNAGGGSASDNTLWLQALIRNKVRNAAIAPIWDPQVVQFAHNMGVGREIPRAHRRQDLGAVQQAGGRRCQ